MKIHYYAFTHICEHSQYHGALPDTFNVSRVIFQKNWFYSINLVV